ncbi:MAG: arginine deiminase family protein [Thermoplasmata archaeon]
MRSTVARAEWDPLKEVLIHRPGIETFFGLLEPYSFLYEQAFSLNGAIQEHRALELALTDAGVEVHRLRQWVIGAARRRPELVERIRSTVLETVHYRGPLEMVRQSRAALRRNLDRFDAESLFNILFLRPTIELERRAGARVIQPRVQLDAPLANLYFMRDQQALTAHGFVFGRMSKPQRRDEPPLTNAILRSMGARVAGSIRSPGTFEGGDFLPAGDFALVGLGDRTNRSGVEQFLRLPTGFSEVAVVRQPAHPLIPGDEPDPMVDMHLDTFLNFPGQGIAVGLEPLLRAARVEVYSARARRTPRREGGTTNLYDYLSAKGFRIVPITTLEQLSYASNFLCLRDRQILTFEVERIAPRVILGLRTAARENPRRYGPLLRQALRDRARLTERRQFFPFKPELADLGVDLRTIRLDQITGGYGAAHCMTCVLRRTPS